MAKILKTIILVILVAVVAVVIYRFVFPEKIDLKEVNKKQDQIDSLNKIIQVREDTLIAVQERIRNLEEEMGALREKIVEKDSQIKYYKDKGRFQYAYSSDSLHRELNAIIKQHLKQAGSPTDSLPR